MPTIKKLLFAALALFSSLYSFSQNWQLVWQDEFTTAVGPDWVFETGNGGWGNNELEYYRRENATIENGQLVITAKRESLGGSNYTSARLKTQGKRSWKYGKIEARIAMPSFQGVWPAFWMLGDNIGSVGWPQCGEIDIMEHINTDPNLYGTIHWQGPNGYANYSNSTALGTFTQYHTYGIEWNADAIKWFVDGRQYAEANIKGNINSTEEFQNNFFIILNMAIGGNWPGSTVDNNAFPAKMYVDYVRVYQAGSGTGGVATLYQNCAYGGTGVSLQPGNYTLAQLQALGVKNDDVSSLRVQAGYEVVLYENDNFGGTSRVIGADDDCLVDNTFNDLTSSVRVRAKVSSFSTLIQAENYSAMSGVQTETTTDAGGGLNVGYVDNGDWMAYNNITIPETGTYLVEYRVARGVAGNGRLSLDLNGGATVLGAVDIPSTGGWQNWTTVSHTVTINAGTYNFGLYAATGGWNINWFRITRSAATQIAAAITAPINEAGVGTSQLSIYPNPLPAGASVLNITGVSGSLLGAALRIYDAKGTTVMNTILRSARVNVSSLRPGVYFAEIRAGGKTFTKQFIKK